MSLLIWSAVAYPPATAGGTADTALDKALNGSLLISIQTTISKAVSPLRSATALQINSYHCVLVRRCSSLMPMP